MIINADNYVPVKSTDGRATPYNTGKVQIGLLYQPKPAEDWFVVSAQACGDDAIGGACSGGFDGMVLDPSSCALVACDVRVGDCGFFNNFDCGVIYARVLVRM